MSASGAGSGQAEALAKSFHESYERLAPQFGYETRRASAKPWAEVPEQNRALMTAVCAEMLNLLVALDEDNYVAWLRKSERGSYVTCDSDAPKAFKVYRHPRLPTITQEPSDRAAWEKSTTASILEQLDRGLQMASDQNNMSAESYERKYYPEASPNMPMVTINAARNRLKLLAESYPVPSATPELLKEFNRNEAKRQRKLQGYKTCVKCGTEWLGDAPCPEYTKESQCLEGRTEDGAHADAAAIGTNSEKSTDSPASPRITFSPESDEPSSGPIAVVLPTRAVAGDQGAATDAGNLTDAKIVAAWEEFNEKKNWGGWERVAFICGFSRGWASRGAGTLREE